MEQLLPRLLLAAPATASTNNTPVTGRISRIQFASPVRSRVGSRFSSSSTSSDSSDSEKSAGRNERLAVVRSRKRAERASVREIFADWRDEDACGSTASKEESGSEESG
ncbi:hypothetical protein K488DRAFT_83340 [Vararia minispora EC-137]|uniref:Uncharacterized protein n=1 Tax=Vararia minispora EC-137 TaxID=1314806 RepID=A0ACB8QU43_9AGAM|nr:hypothetical protein K488DRAFT_83340 [Vararia minispora EC-137]